MLPNLIYVAYKIRDKIQYKIRCDLAIGPRIFVKVLIQLSLV